MEGELLSHISSAATTVYLIQWLKRCPRYQRFVQWAPIRDRWVHRIISFVGAALGAEGIHIAVTGTVSEGFQLGVSIPPILVMLHTTWDIFSQFMVQQVGHDLATKKGGA